MSMYTLSTNNVDATADENSAEVAYAVILAALMEAAEEGGEGFMLEDGVQVFSSETGAHVGTWNLVYLPTALSLEEDHDVT